MKSLILGIFTVGLSGLAQLFIYLAFVPGLALFFGFAAAIAAVAGGFWGYRGLPANVPAWGLALAGIAAVPWVLGALDVGRRAVLG